MLMHSLMTKHKAAVTESRGAEKLLAREAEKGRSIWIASEQDEEGYMVYDHIRKHSHVCSPLYSISHITDTHLPENTGSQRGVICLCCWCSGLKLWR